MTIELIAYYLVVINVLTFIAYGIDKWKAKFYRWRISDTVLLAVAMHLVCDGIDLPEPAHDDILRWCE